MTNKELCLNLIKTDKENEVVNILRKASYWDDASYWKYYGNMENNFSTIGNQQKSPSAALVEKIINAVDAVLMKECLIRDIYPDSEKAPKTIQEALKEYFKIREGKLSNVTPYDRGELAENINLVATGDKKIPSYTIVDLGEGQYPYNFQKTFFSLNKSNKLRIPFVQGKFNMGGTGVLQFCGERNLQLIVSKRHTEIAKLEQKDNRNLWGFSIVRRENPSKGVKSSSYKYLAPEGDILSFKADGIPAIPGDYPEAYKGLLKHGTIVKLYEYQIGASLRTNIVFDLFNNLSLLMPQIALPIRLYERREGYRGHTKGTVLSGLTVRLEEDKRSNVEQGFPSSTVVTIKGQEMKITIYAFKENSETKYKKNEGIIFTVNGQTQASISKRFFTRKKVSLGYIADSILIVVDCTNLNGRKREDLFMNSRDRLRGGDFEDEIEKKLEDLLNKHNGLRELNQERRRKKVEGKLKDSRPLKDVLENILKDSPTLSRLFIQGKQLQNPFRPKSVASKEEFKGEEFPSFFNIDKEYTLNKPKKCPINNNVFRIRFLTDAENNFFTRPNSPGTYEVTSPECNELDYYMNLWNGVANLNITVPENSSVGDIFEFRTKVYDLREINIFESSFFVKITESENKNKTSAGERLKPSSRKEGNQTRGLHGLNIPEVTEVTEDQWDKYNFDQLDALSVVKAEEKQYDFFINIDNWHLKTEQKRKKNTDPKILEARYKYGLVIMGLAVINQYEEQNENGDDSIEDLVRNFSRAMSPFILPMIEGLGSIEPSDFAKENVDLA
ncbi:MAG: hypothetical protein FXF54_04765 [Kosmotoga sp.]|nr:MAG: hypothetical protein FXF54_04765 [Kosmotoga sp.]